MTTSNSDIALGCQCGNIAGVITNKPKSLVNHISCYCVDCRTFSQHLNANAITLDENGGSAIVQTSPACIKITNGQEYLKCLRLGPKGITRWYSGCCNTPIANTMNSGKVPFAGVIRSFVKAENVESIIGPIKYRVFASLAPEGIGHKKAPVGLIAKMATGMLRWKLRGDHKNSPFFGSDTGEPIVEPIILTKEQRAAASSVG